jgi:predicted flap endonuclease-1-like 5' DNA nuclease
MSSSILDSDSSCDLLTTKFDEGISMASERSPANRAAESARTDDLKLINGIGPAVEKRLNGVGVSAFAQLAALSPADIASAVANIAGLTAERIIKQDWIGQARRLAEESTSSEVQEKVEASADTEQIITLTAPDEPAASVKRAPATPCSVELEKVTTPSIERYHPATFTVELLLDENNIVYRTHVSHVQSRREYTWSDWPGAELVDFLGQSASVNFASDEPVLANAEEPEQTPALVADSGPPTSAAAKPALAGTLHLRDMKVLTAGSSEPRRLLSHDQLCDVRLALDLSEITVSSNTPLNYKVSIYRKSRQYPSGQVIREAEGAIESADTVTIDVEGNLLPGGSYRLAATVILALPGTKPTSKPDIMAVIDGNRLRVF